MNAPPCDTPLSGRTPHRVLVVDDEKRMADSLNTLLTQCGYEVEIAYNGNDALKILNEKDCPLVITDLRMAGMDGLELMRAAETRPQVGFIVITGYPSAENAIEALRRHALDFIPKPFDFDALKFTIEKAFLKIDGDRFREDMLSMITHDIKIPLSSILGYSSLIFEKGTGELNPRAKEFVQTISSNGLKILTLIDNFLTSCKIDAGKLAIYPRDVNLQYLIEDLMTMFEVEFERNHLTVETRLEEGLPVIRGDESLLYRALANVFSNACKFTPPDGQIIIATTVLDAARSPLQRRSVRIEVSNSGVGIPADDLDSIFDKFRRSPAHAGVEGSGIGSYVLQQVIEAHGGRVAVSSVPNALTTFSIILPVEATSCV